MRTTLKDIAKYLNVSVTTVSRAINDKGDISPQMRQKVLEVAKMLDYKPNSVAISLRKKTANKLIGVIIPTLDHYFFSTILSGITTSDFTDDDYMIMIGESNHDVVKEKELIEKFQDHYVTGIIIVPTRMSRWIYSCESSSFKGTKKDRDLKRNRRLFDFFISRERLSGCSKETRCRSI